MPFFAEGTLLLCLIGKLLDACKYLCQYNEYERATVLAKTWPVFTNVVHCKCVHFQTDNDINQAESAGMGSTEEVIRKWADSLLHTEMCDKV